MKILYVGMMHDYGDARRGYSYEHYNFYETLVRMGHDVTYFDFIDELRSSGKEQMNGKLLRIACSLRPDMVFCILFRDEITPKTIRKISGSSGAITYNWFCDDHWRFESFSRHMAPAFDWVSTTSSEALPKYAAIGYKNVIKTQWACNHFSYQRLDMGQEYDVSFVGQPHGTRRVMIEALRKSGLDVRTWGQGWPEGRLTQEQMVETFNRSRINLNFSEASTAGSLVRNVKRRFFGSHRPLPTQIKGRVFEVPGCGGFLLTGAAENLVDYFKSEREVSVFVTLEELRDKISYYLDHPLERQAIADAGYERTIQEHTFERRFNDIFSTIGLKNGS